MRGFSGGAVVNNLPVSVGDVDMWLRSLGWEDPLKQEMATRSSILPWKIPRVEETCRL